MRPETIHKLCCPFDKHDLQLTVITEEVNTNILEGILACKSCSRIYPIVKGIPIMNPDEFRELSLEQPLLESWQQYLEKGKTIKNFRLLDQESRR